MDLITDRTAADVQRWRMLRDKGWAAMTERERSEWLSPMKGAYNCTDMNRVESAVAFLVERLQEAGYPLQLTTKTNWTASDAPTRGDMERYLGNVEKIRNTIVVSSTTPDAPSIDEIFDFEKANNIERILLDVNSAIERLDMSFWRAGELYAGEV